MKIRRGNASCRAVRSPCCRWPTGAARSCGRCPRPRRSACWRWTTGASATSSAPRAAFPLKLQLAQGYQAERLVLLGDAAHAVHPLAGQGVNLGLRDVAELRDCLLAAQQAGRDLGAPHVLRRYARRRRSADTLDALGFDALARIYAWQSPPLVAARGLGVRLLDHLPPLKRRLSEHAAGL